MKYAQYLGAGTMVILTDVHSSSTPGKRLLKSACSQGSKWRGLNGPAGRESSKKRTWSIIVPHRIGKGGGNVMRREKRENRVWGKERITLKAAAQGWWAIVSR